MSSGWEVVELSRGTLTSHLAVEYEIPMLVGFVGYQGRVCLS